MWLRLDPHAQPCETRYLTIQKLPCLARCIYTLSCRSTVRFYSRTTMDDDTTQAWKTKEHDNSPDISDLEAGPPLPPPPPPQNVNPYYSPRRTDSWPKAPSSVEPPRVESYRISDTPAMIIRPYSRNSRPHKLSATPEHATGHGDPPFILPVQQQLTQQEHPLSPAKRNDFSSPPPNTLLLDPEIISSAELGSISQPTVRRLPSFMQSTEIHNPNPPEAVIKEVQATRLGTTGAKLAAEAAYQVDIAPPVRRRTPPPAIHIDFGGIPQNPAEEPKYMNHSTWAVPGPEVAGLAPPIGQLPMSSPGTAGYAPPVHQVPMSTPHAPQPGAGATHDAYDVSRPTCSLNLVCYRSGAGGCVLRQVQAVLESRFADKETFRAALAQNPQLVATDAQLFRALRRAYWKEMSGFWRRHLSLKTLRGLRVLAVCVVPILSPHQPPFSNTQP